MASIHEVQAGLAQAAAHGGATIREIRAAREILEGVAGDVRVLGAGTGHPHIDAALNACKRGMEQLHEATNLIYGATEATRNYGNRLG
ncbi:hypothetical protein O7608_07480 [Solwaraspora sp. WMMA2056]|uniref:hypothetical protein n=1 Tax=Solwaraspora sp. WMMA2056 TaxID=3015161 RepID=UPI00259BC378|nr:hypothetical protein [Solwaraspora sp. WMMA2056]WJK42219.1 hypothetical protein O7608_07480 [Solwaraspora sp. WMMA2056]